MRYDELIVADVMTPLAMLDAVDLDVMRRASVSNVIATLQRHGRNHLLVVEGSAEFCPLVRPAFLDRPVLIHPNAFAPASGICAGFVSWTVTFRRCRNRWRRSLSRLCLSEPC